MNEPETETDDPQIEVEAVDVDEIVRQERVRSIFESRRQTREARNAGKEAKAEGVAKRGRAHYRNALEGYVREVEPLCSQTAAGRRLWSKHNFGTIDITPTVEEVPGDTDAQRLRDGTLIRSAPDGREIQIRGLKALFNLSPPFTAQFAVNVQTDGWDSQKEVKQLQVDRDFPFAVLDGMFSAVNGYLAEIGFDVQVGQAQKHTKLDDDLLSEVEQWRRENL
jgi:hypothetical protein